jgi:hypothetical protein
MLLSYGLMARIEFLFQLIVRSVISVHKTKKEIEYIFPHRKHIQKIWKRIIWNYIVDVEMDYATEGNTSRESNSGVTKKRTTPGSPTNNCVMNTEQDISFSLCAVPFIFSGVLNLQMLRVNRSPGTEMQVQAR